MLEAEALKLESPSQLLPLEEVAVYIKFGKKLIDM